MKVEVMIPSEAVEFNFDSACTSPNVSAPSTPRGFGNFFFSAPTSPTRFNWEESPPILPFIKDKANNDHNPDFEFDFNAQLNAPHLSADELFDCGKIKPKKLNPESRIAYSPKSPPSPKIIQFKEGLSPRKKNNQFSGAIRRTPGGLPIIRVSDILLEEEESCSKEASSSASNSPSSWCKRWKLRDLLLFRSASEGRGESRKDHPLKKSEIEDVKNSIYRSTAVANSVHIITKRRKEKVGASAHELHYTVNRAVSLEMRRKTLLPYRKTVLFGGC